MMDDLGFKPVYGNGTGDGTLKTFFTLTPDNWPLDGQVRIIRWQTIIYNVHDQYGNPLTYNPGWFGVTCSYDADTSGNEILFNVVEPFKWESSWTLPAGFGKLFPRAMNESPAPSFKLKGLILSGYTFTYFVTFTWVREQTP